jgi:hypothetical protein
LPLYREARAGLARIAHDFAAARALYGKRRFIMSNKTVAVLSTLAVAALPVAAVAHPPKPHHPPKPPHPAKPSHPPKPPPPPKAHKCRPHAVAYRVSGTLVSSSLTLTGKNRASGTITITVTGANKPARNAGVAKGNSQSYTLSGVKVSYAHSVSQPNPAAGTRTVVKGTITVVAPKCQDKTGAGQVTIKHVAFTPPPKAKA